MVIIVQFLTAYQECPRDNISGCIITLEIPVATVVAYAIDNTGCKKRHGDHLDGENSNTWHTEEKQVGKQQQNYSCIREAQIDIFFQPVIRRAASEFFYRLRIVFFLPI